jgi:hypothetical protein
MNGPYVHQVRVGYDSCCYYGYYVITFSAQITTLTLVIHYIHETLHELAVQLYFLFFYLMNTTSLYCIVIREIL